MCVLCGLCLICRTTNCPSPSPPHTGSSAPSRLTNTAHARALRPGRSDVLRGIDAEARSTLMGRCSGRTGEQAQRPVSAGERGLGGFRGLRHTSPPKKQYSTHFCIRIYYLKGSLKIKILYSIRNFVLFSFSLSVNKVVLRKRGRRVRGGQDQLFSGRRPLWAGGRPGPEHPRALPRPSGTVCWGGKVTAGLFLLGCNVQAMWQMSQHQTQTVFEK